MLIKRSRRAQGTRFATDRRRGRRGRCPIRPQGMRRARMRRDRLRPKKANRGGLGSPRLSSQSAGPRLLRLFPQPDNLGDGGVRRDQTADHRGYGLRRKKDSAGPGWGLRSADQHRLRVAGLRRVARGQSGGEGLMLRAGSGPAPGCFEGCGEVDVEVAVLGLLAMASVRSRPSSAITVSSRVGRNFFIRVGGFELQLRASRGIWYGPEPRNSLTESKEFSP